MGRQAVGDVSLGRAVREPGAPAAVRPGDRLRSLQQVPAQGLTGLLTGEL